MEDSDLERHGQLLSEWIAQLDAPDTELREYAAIVLDDFALDCHLDSKPVPAMMVAALVDALRDPEDRVRGKAARALGDIGEAAQRALPHLIGMLADEEEEEAGARVEIARAAALLGGASEAAPVLLKLLQDGTDEVREAAAAALEDAHLTGLDIENQLCISLADESPVVQTWVCWSLWRLTKEARELVPILVASMRDERARLNAARLLCWMKDQAVSALPHLIALRDDPNWMVRLQAVRATILIPCSDMTALPVLEVLRDDPNQVVRGYAAEELKKRQH